LLHPWDKKIKVRRALMDPPSTVQREGANDV
jgi:hypothetical protein